MTAAGEDLAPARTEAIRESGFGRKFRLIQTHNLAFWVYLLLVVVGLLATYQQIQGSLLAFQGSLVFSALLFTAYTVPFWLFLRHIDRFDSVPEKLALAAFVYGGIVATGAMAIWANNAAISLWGKANGQEFASNWAAALTAPFVEELAKGSGLILLIVLAPRLIRTAFDGLIVGAFLGLGFQIVEDVTYGINSAFSDFGSNSINATSTTSVMRVVVGLTSHWMYSGIFCAGLIYLVGRPDEQRRIGRGLLLVLSAMALHGLWDASGGFTSINTILFPVIYIGVPVALIVLFSWIYRVSVVTERRWMRELMAPEVALGVVSQEDVDALAGSRKQRKAYIRAHRGHRSHVHAKRVLHAGGDLATQIARDGGMDTDRVRFARSEVDRVRSA